MKQQLYMLGGDRRTVYVLTKLTEWGWKCQTHGVPGLPDAPLTAASCWLLPYPAIRNGRIPGTDFSLRDLAALLRPGDAVLGGLSDAGAAELQSTGAVVINLAKDEQLLIRNAVATAEGALALAIERTPFTLWGAPCLVIGFGRIGKALAQRLQAMRAVVTVSARKPRDLAIAEACGFATCVTGAWQSGLAAYRCVFNTVPAPVFTEADAQILREDCLVWDLASAPFGLTQEAAALLGQRYQAAGGLPGKLSPESAGLYYAQAVRRYLEQEAL